MNIRCTCGAWAKIEATRKTPEGVVRVYACAGGCKFRSDGKPMRPRALKGERDTAMAAALASGLTTREVAALFGVNQSTAARAAA